MAIKAISFHTHGYRDIYFRITIALIAAHFIIAFGIEKSFWELLLIPDYYKSLLGSFVIAFVLVNIIYYVTVRLDRSYSWHGHTVKRAALQFSFGLAIPSITAFLLAAVYFRIFGINILDTVYLKYDFPVIVLFLLLLNLYYLVFYLYRQSQFSENQVTTSPSTVQVFMVQRGTKIIPLTVEAIAYFYHTEQLNFIRSMEGEDFVIPETLDQIQQQMDAKQFFRVNRQMVVHFPACEHLELLPYGKLALFVKPSYKEPIVISQKRAKNFKEWMERK